MDVFAPYEQPQQGESHTANKAAALESALQTAVDGLMATAQGRLLLRWLLHLCRNFSVEDVGNAPTSTESARLLFTEGRRMVGMRLMRLLQQANAAHIPTLLQTKENDSHDLSTF